jgi:hypothetical protein
MVDTTDLKSVACKGVRVRIPLSVLERACFQVLKPRQRWGFATIKVFILNMRRVSDDSGRLIRNRSGKSLVTRAFCSRPADSAYILVQIQISKRTPQKFADFCTAHSALRAIRETFETEEFEFSPAPGWASGFLIISYHKKHESSGSRLQAGRHLLGHFNFKAAQASCSARSED